MTLSHLFVLFSYGEDRHDERPEWAGACRLRDFRYRRNRSAMILKGGLPLCRVSFCIAPILGEQITAV